MFARLGPVVAFDFASRYHTRRIQTQGLVTGAALKTNGQELLQRNQGFSLRSLLP